MNDRAVAVLENYDMEVLRTWKGRSSILMETTEGLRVLKEYNGPLEKLQVQKEILKAIAENGYPNVEQIFLTKEGEYTCSDYDGTYVLKSIWSGRECNIKEEMDCRQMLENMAKLHKSMYLPEVIKQNEIKPQSAFTELEKHTKELRKVRKFLTKRSQKNTFELALLKNYDFFYEKACKVWEEGKLFFAGAQNMWFGYLCHGDMQHHNALLNENQVYFLNFEKYCQENPTKDLVLFLRKIMEKNNWSLQIGQQVLEWYQKERPLAKEEWMGMYYRLAYPEKFWKIVNFYYNSGKSWIPERNGEKLDKLLTQESQKEIFLEWILQKI